MSDSKPAKHPGNGRLFSEQVRVGVADAAPSGRCRLDAIARWVQDVAYSDLVDAGLAGTGVWIVRRNRIVVERFPRFWEPVRLETWCSGSSRLCAERRTRLSKDAGTLAEAVTLWVNLDRDGGVPRRLGEDFHAVFGPSTAGRKVKARLNHPPAPGPSGEPGTWSFRATDLDVANHVNNAALWHVLEQELIAANPEPDRIDAEIEYHAPAALGAALLLRDGDMRWLTTPEGETLASIAVRT